MYNSVLISAISSWLIAQVIKTLLNFLITKKINPERLIGAGGMPSAHSAFVMSALVSVGKVEGLGSTMFGLAFVISMITIYDAMGVRRAAGEHAKWINIFMLDKDKDGKVSKKEETDLEINFKKLQEYIGHTPVEVLFGCLLGVVIALIVPASI